jgi:hypothetical protein
MRFASRLTELPLATGGRFLYRYDYGDDWEHDLVVEGVVPVTDPEDPCWPVWLGMEGYGTVRHGLQTAEYSIVL